MTLFFSLLPFYILGNFHCLGMCGPLVLMLGAHRYKIGYFFGRILAYSMAGGIAAEMGILCQTAFNYMHLPICISLLFGILIFTTGVYSLFGWQYPLYRKVQSRLHHVSKKASLLLLQDKLWPTFLFGVFTLFLPCGQTIVVFSACALTQDPLDGLFNGFAFALLTSPSLLFAMQLHRLLGVFKRYYNPVMGFLSMLIGGLSICRSLAETGVISHFEIAQSYIQGIHLILF